MFYREFAQRLKTDRSIFALSSPFLGEGEAELPPSVEDLASQYVDAIVQLQPNGPYLIGGYSFGGVAAYEIARKLAETGEEIEQTIIFDIANPAKVQYNSALTRLKEFWKRQESESAVSKSLKLSRRLSESIHDRAKFEIENRVATARTPKNVGGTFWRHKLVRGKHMAIEEVYTPEAASIPLRLVIADGNSSKFCVDETMGWGDLVTDLETAHVDGSHLELFEDPWLDGIVAATEKFIQS